MQKILGLTEQDDNTYRIKNNDVIYKYMEKITTTIQKRRMKFFVHIRWMTTDSHFRLQKKYTNRSQQ